MIFVPPSQMCLVAGVVVQMTLLPVFAQSEEAPSLLVFDELFQVNDRVLFVGDELT